MPFGFLLARDAPVAGERQRVTYSGSQLSFSVPAGEHISTAAACQLQRMFIGLSSRSDAIESCMAAFDIRISDTFNNTVALVEATVSKAEQLCTPVVREHVLSTLCPNTCTPGNLATASLSADEFYCVSTCD